MFFPLLAPLPRPRYLTTYRRFSGLGLCHRCIGKKAGKKVTLAIHPRFLSVFHGTVFDNLSGQLGMRLLAEKPWRGTMKVGSGGESAGNALAGNPQDRRAPCRPSAGLRFT